MMATIEQLVGRGFSRAELLHEQAQTMTAAEFATAIHAEVSSGESDGTGGEWRDVVIVPGCGDYQWSRQTGRYYGWGLE